jgi:hypothetical protein
MQKHGKKFNAIFLPSSGQPEMARKSFMRSGTFHIRGKWACA